jgi:hypothetical protein
MLCDCFLSHSCNSFGISLLELPHMFSSTTEAEEEVVAEGMGYVYLKHFFSYSLTPYVPVFKGVCAC